MNQKQTATPANTFDAGDLPANDLDNLGRGIQRGGTRIELPFDALPIWWKNGDSRLKQVGGALYMGGWGVQGSEMDKLIAAGYEVPAGFTLTENAGAGGESYEAYYSRTVACAVIALRSRWVEDKRNGGYKKYSQTQYLVRLANFDRQQGYNPWGFAVLSGKSNSGQAIASAVAEFQNATAKSRLESTKTEKFPKGLPVNAFWMHLGTFGNEPNVEYVGKGDRKSPITPCMPFIPKDITRDFLAKCYIGGTELALLIDARNNAEEWLQDWNKTQGKLVTIGGEVDDTEAPAVSAPEDEFPF